MKCQVAASKLSALLDEELDLSELSQVRQHVAGCEFCREEIRRLEQLGEALRSSEALVDINSMWSSIERRLEVARPQSSFWFRSSQTGWAIAASALFILVGIAWLLQSNVRLGKDIEHNHTSLAVDFQPAIELVSTDPVKALQKLVEKYQGKQLSGDETAKYLGYQPATSKSVPNGFKLVSTHVLDMPCCKCSASICQRVDGSSLIVFEHKYEQPLWFGKSSSTVEQCAGVECRIVESAGQLAVSWRRGQRQFTMTGATDRSEVEKWIQTMDL